MVSCCALPNFSSKESSSLSSSSTPQTLWSRLTVELTGTYLLVQMKSRVWVRLGAEGIIRKLSPKNCIQLIFYTILQINITRPSLIHAPNLPYWKLFYASFRMEQVGAYELSSFGFATYLDRNQLGIFCRFIEGCQDSSNLFIILPEEPIECTSKFQKRTQSNSHLCKSFPFIFSQPNIHNLCHHQNPHRKVDFGSKLVQQQLDDKQEWEIYNNNNAQRRRLVYNDRLWFQDFSASRVSDLPVITSPLEVAEDAKELQLSLHITLQFLNDTRLSYFRIRSFISFGLQGGLLQQIFYLDDKKGQEGHDEQRCAEVYSQQTDCYGFVTRFIEWSAQFEPIVVKRGLGEQQPKSFKEGYQPQKSKTKDEEEQEEDESCNIALPYAVIDPSTVMIVLSNAHLAHLAMISSFRNCSFTIKTVSLYSFLSSNQQLIEVLAISSPFRSFQQTQIQQKHYAEDSNFGSKSILMCKLDDKVENRDIENKRSQEYNRNAATTMLRFILNLYIAVKLDNVTTRKLLIQHLAYSLVLIFSCHLKGQKIRVISKIPVRSFYQQFAHNSRISIVDCHHKWCVSFIIATIQSCQLLAGQQIADHFFTTHVAGPVERTAAVVIALVDADAIFEVDQWQNHVGLGCQMQYIEACVGCQLLVDTEIFIKVLDHVHMPVVASIEQCGEALTVLQVHPDCDLLVLVPLVQLLLTSSSLAKESFCPRDKEPHDIQLSFVGQLMQNGVFLGIGQRDKIQIRMLVQVVTEFINLPIGEEKIDYLALFSSSRLWLTGFDHNIKQSLLTQIII